MRALYHYQLPNSFNNMRIDSIMISHEFLEWVEIVENESFEDTRLDFLFLNECGAYFRESLILW